MSELRKRPRRLRATPLIRAMVREVELAPDDLIYPLFVMHGRGQREPIASMPGVDRLTVDRLGAEVTAVARAGIPAVLLFGIPEAKDPEGSHSHRPDGVVQRAVAAIKREVPELVVVTDVCLCQYTDHGHCGLVDERGTLLNDPTAKLLARIAVSHVQAGADLVAPSAMIDGQVGAIRCALDEVKAENVPILSYAAKYASAFYGPFRDAAEGAPKHGDRTTHQMDPANVREALKEVALDLEEGADLVMVKPALAYLDVIRAVRDAFPAVPLAAYNVSGEYAMLKAAAERGWLDERRAVLETLTAMRRAGADLVITYHAKDAAAWLKS